jgi:hypothetical protein
LDNGDTTPQIYFLDILVQPDENMITYYLHSENKMDLNSSTKTQSSKKKLSKVPIEFKCIPIERKIYLKHIYAEI